jgi:DNA repair exonuclease SbcCD ATPase subunit
VINFEKAKFKNLFAYGQNWTEIDFKQGVNKYSGSTGEGKSSIVEIIFWILFGKCYRNINLSMMLNNINKKEGEGYIWFKINSDSYRIERGMKPNFLRIYKNNVIVPVPASSRTYQEILEQDILKTTPNIFEQTSYKSLTKKSAFLTLTKEKRREVIDPILNIHAYTKMNKLAKEMIDSLDKEISSLNKDISYNDILISQEKDHLLKLKQLKDEQASKSATKIDDIKKQIEALEADSEKKRIAIEKIQKYKSKKEELQTKINEINLSTSKYQSQIITIDSTIAAQESDKANQEKRIKYLQKTCGTCEKIKSFENEMNAPIDNSIILQQQKDFKIKINENNLKISELQVNINKCQEYINLERGFKDNIVSNSSYIANYKQQIESEQEQEIVIDDSKLKGYLEKKKKLEKEYNENVLEKKHYAFARTHLTDEKVKAFVVKKYLPSINDYLSLYLQKFGAECLFKLNEEWEEEFSARQKKDFKYESMSEGQKSIADLSIIFTFISFCLLKYNQSSSNLLIMDEVGQGLDKDLQQLFYQILKEFTEKNNKCTIMMSHNDVPPRYIDHHYMVERNSGFSTIKEI